MCALYFNFYVYSVFENSVSLYNLKKGMKKHEKSMNKHVKYVVLMRNLKTMYKNNVQKQCTKTMYKKKEQMGGSNPRVG